MKNLPTNLSNLKRIINKLDVDKLLSVRVNLSKSSDVVKNDVVEKIFMMLRKKILKTKYLTLLTELLKLVLMLEQSW